jgi:hypothetical protein
VTLTGENFVDGLGLMCKFGLLDGTDSEATYVPANVTSPTLATCSPSVHTDGTVNLTLSYNGLDEHQQAAISFEYTRCAPGFVSEALSIPCYACPPGTFSSAIGSKKCSKCERNSFSPDLASTFCTLCPNNTSIEPEPRDSLAKCTCLPGFFQPDNITGVICSSCPRGGDCPGELAYPVASVGFWADEKGSDLSFLKCDNREACPGGRGSVCAPNFEGRLCAECSEGYYAIKGQCDKCPPRGPWRMGLFILFCPILSTSLIKMVGKHSTTSGGVVGIATFFFQVLGMIRRLDLNLPFSFLFTVDVVTMPFTLDLDLIASECAYRSSYMTKWGLMWFLPFIFLGLFFVQYLLYALHVTLFNRRARLEVDIREGDGYDVLFVADAPTSEKDVRNRVINAFLMFLSLIYVLPVTKSLEIFDCSVREDGKISLDARPSLICFEAWWYKLAPVGGAGVIFYGILLPTALCVLIRRGRRRLTDPDFISRYGSIYVDYRTKVSFWEAVLMSQKLLMLVPIMFFTSFPEFQTATFLLILFMGLILQLVFRPYFLERYNRLQVVLRWCSSLILVLGIGYRENIKFYRTKSRIVPSQENGMLALLFSFLFIGIFLIGFVIIFDVTRVYLEIKKRISPLSRMYADRLMHPHGRTVIVQWFARGSIGQDFDQSLCSIMASIALDYRRLRRDLLTGVQVEETGVMDQSLDRFIDLISGSFFMNPIVPVVRRWLLLRLSQSNENPTAFGEASMFMETFSQLYLFQKQLLKSRSSFFRPERGVNRTDSDRFAALYARKEGREIVWKAIECLKALYCLDLVKDSCLFGIVKQVHRGKDDSVSALGNAFTTMQALLTLDRLSKATKHGASAVFADDGGGGGAAGEELGVGANDRLPDGPSGSSNGQGGDGDGGGEGGEGGGGGDEFVSMDARATLVGKKIKVEGVAEATQDLVARPRTKAEIAPLLEILYESTFSPLAILTVATQLAGGAKSAGFIMSSRSPFPSLHSLFVTTRDERDEGSVRYGYENVWVEMDPTKESLSNFASSDVILKGTGISADEIGLDGISNLQAIAAGTGGPLRKPGDSDSEGADAGGALSAIRRNVSAMFGGASGYASLTSRGRKKGGMGGGGAGGGGGGGGPSSGSQFLVRKRILKRRRGFMPPRGTKDIEDRSEGEDEGLLTGARGSGGRGGGGGGDADTDQSGFREGVQRDLRHTEPTLVMTPPTIVTDLPGKTESSRNNKSFIVTP